MLAFPRFCAKNFHPLPCTKPPHTVFCTFLLLKVLGHRPARPTRMDQKSMEALEEEDLTFLQQYKTPLKKDRKAVREVSLETFQKLDLEATKERKPVRPRRSSTDLIPLHKIPAPPRRVKFTKVEMKELMAKRKMENSRIRANPTKRGKFKLVPSQLSKDKSPDYPPELRLSVVHHLLNTKVRARGGSWFCLACLINTCASPSFPHMFSPLLVLGDSNLPKHKIFKLGPFRGLSTTEDGEGHLWICNSSRPTEEFGKQFHQEILHPGQDKIRREVQGPDWQGPPLPSVSLADGERELHTLIADAPCCPEGQSD
jgi:hypothetical protein